MNVEMFTCGIATGSKGDNLAGCGVVLFMGNKDKRLFRRVMAMGIGRATANMAGLQAARIALMSITKEVMDKAPNVMLQTDNHYTHTLLLKEDDKYKVEPKSNQDAVAALREWADKFDLLVPIYNKYNPAERDIYECVKQAKAVAYSQDRYDSGTIRLDDVKTQSNS